MRRGLILALCLVLLASPSWGQIALQTLQVYGTTIVRAQLLTNAVAVTDGQWVDISGLANSSIHVAGITTATVEVDGSNEITRPANTSHGIKLNASDITADQMVFLTVPVRWLKVRVTAWTSGTINAYFEGRAP